MRVYHGLQASPRHVPDLYLPFWEFGSGWQESAMMALASKPITPDL